MTMYPKKTIQKALISTTSRFVGEYEKNGMLLTHAWNFYNRDGSIRSLEGPASRNAYIFAFETEEEEPKIGPVPDYSPSGELLCAYLGILFGKRFDSHGLTESVGHFYLPDLSQFSQLCDHTLPQNSQTSRIDFPMSLNLAEVSRIEHLLVEDTLDAKFLRTFQAAAKFYLRAMQNAESDPEVAYFHLFTAGEILANFYEYDKDQLLDDKTIENLAKIREGLTDGAKIASFFSGKMLLIKRRFIDAITNLVDASFFERSETTQPRANFKADSFRAAISAAYDLRSKYVHTGTPFGRWITPDHLHSEVQVGQPVVEDRELGRVLSRAPTYIGLERVMRYCLLRFAEVNGAYVEPDKHAINA